MKKHLLNMNSVLVMTVIFSAVVFSQTTEFTYQGSLQNSSAPATGNFDFEFRLFDSLSSGSQFGQTLTRSAVAVANGTFAVKLNFQDFFPGANRFLEIRVRQTGGGAFTPLAPRQQVNSAPYAVKALNADDTSRLGGLGVNQFVTITSGRYIENNNGLQADSNFSISGNGRAGGMFSANIVNATTQFNLDGIRALYIGGPGGNGGVDAVFAGQGAGFSNTTGSSNSFFGAGAGYANTTGSSNSFFGRAAGQASTGTGNAFFGGSAGVSNTTGGNNAFFGTGAGLVNTTGGNNTIIGYTADVGANNLNFATAIGAGSVVSSSNTVVLGRLADTVRIPGTLSITGAFTANGSGLTNLNAANIATGTLDVARLGGGVILNGASQQPTSDFNISGNGTAGGTLSSNIVNAATQYNIGGSRILSNAGANNLFAGLSAGSVNTGGGNSFFGPYAGASNTTGGGNSFFGLYAGGVNTTGSDNSFVGMSAGQLNTTGGGNSFFGFRAGLVNTTGGGNSFFGYVAGQANTTGIVNAFFGWGAGGANTTGGYNAFFGQGAGQNNTEGYNNAFFGQAAGLNNTTGISNTIIGNNANVGSGDLRFATAIGAGSVVSASNTVVLGRPADAVQIPGAFTANIVNTASQFNVGGSRILSNAGAENLFAGVGAGQSNTTGGGNAFFGKDAGFSNTTACCNAFFGFTAGISNTTGSSNAFFGTQAGQSNTTGANNTTIGGLANVGSGDLTFATAIGAGAIVSTSNTVVLGRPADAVQIPGALSVTGGAAYGGTLSANIINAATLSANIINAGTQFNIGGSRILSNAGTSNLFAGVSAGGAITTGFGNAFFGTGTGSNNTTGDGNSFFGTEAGLANTTGFGNAFFGFSAGYNNTTGTQNAFFGVGAGPNNTTGGGNSFFGKGAGDINTTGGGNTIIGVNANVGSPDLTFATAIGAGAVVSNSNTIALGRTDGSDKVVVYGLGAAGATALCRNASNQISTCSSSVRYKSNINPFTSGLDLVRKLRPVSFNWKDGGMADMGLVAEEVAAVEPLLTTTNAKGEIEGVKYDRVGVVLVNAVKEQQVQIETQQKQIDEQNVIIKKQQEKSDRQQTEIDALKQLVCSQNPAAKICLVKEEKR